MTQAIRNERLSNHRAMHPKFPYDSTVDQFFDESQFESYRELGLHAVQTMLTQAKAAPKEASTDPTNGLACSFATPAANKEPPKLHEYPTRELFDVMFKS